MFDFIFSDKEPLKDKPAIIDAFTDERYTYGQLKQLSLSYGAG